jgi:nitrite reductase/ring-hydroxylating ferredoxin subunit
MSEQRDGRALVGGTPAAPRGAEGRGTRWRAEFPYHWDADDLVSRRELLQFAVYTSGALFSVTALLALLGLIRRTPAEEARPIARVGEIVEGQAVYFRYPDPDDEAVLLRLPGERFVAYSQKCTHLSCAVYYQADHQRLFCPCHDGVFNVLTGDPEAGPPQRRLPRIALRRDGDLLYATGVEA